MTPQEFLALGERRLAAAELPDPRLEAEFLLAEITGRTRYDWMMPSHAVLDAPTVTRLTAGLTQREARRPLAYIVGHQPFLDFDVSVTPDVLIPRPETERLAEQILTRLDARPELRFAVDVGTGSGCLALALARHAHIERVEAIDISTAALTVAAANAVRLGLESRITWVRSDLLECWQPPGLHPVFMVANLPYIRHADLRTLAPEVRQEPRLALDGGENGLFFVQRLLVQAADRLAPGSELWLEIGFDQADAVIRLLQQAPGWVGIGAERDYAGIARYIRAERRSH